MKKILAIAISAAVLVTGCRKIEVDGETKTVIINGGGTTTGQTITLEGKITKDTVLRAANIYILKGLVYMTNNATMTLEPGTTVKGDIITVGGLVITRGAKLVAQGAVDKPIVFTSSSASPRSGDWAGIVLLGKAPTNSSFNGTAG